MSREAWHGTVGGYSNHGCRCDDCRRAKREYSRTWAAKNPERVAASGARWANSGPRADQHGTPTGYRRGCRCPECRAAHTSARRRWRRGNPEKVRQGYARFLEYQREWRARDPEYARERERARAGRIQAESLSDATRWTRWEPREDALLALIPSNIAAADALGRTYYSVKQRRRALREKGLLP